MSRQSAHETLYTMVDDMTKDNATHEFNFDWKAKYNADKTHSAKPNGEALITIEIGNDTNVDDAGGLGSGEYFDEAPVTMTCSVAISTPDVAGSEIGYYQDIEIDKAVDDVKARFSYPWKLATDDVHSLRYTGCNIIESEKAGKFTTKKVVCNFNMKYRTVRTLLD